MAAATNSDAEGGHGGGAIGYVLFAVVTWSLLPILVDLSGAMESPFMFNGGWRLGGFLGCAGFLLIRYRSLLFDRAVIRLLGSRIIVWAILLALIGKFEIAFFALSTRFVDVSVAAILYETWTIVMIIVTARLFQKQGRYRRVNVGMFAMLSVGLAGFAFVIVSQVGGFSAVAFDFNSETIYGLVIVIVAMWLAGDNNARILRWGSDIGQTLSQDDDRKEQQRSLELFGVMAGQAIAHLCFVPSFAIGLGIGEDLTSRLLAFSVIGGFLAAGPAGILWVAANLRTRNLGINALVYATPCLSLIWLFVFSRVGVALPDYLVIGAALIVTANILINFEGEIRWGFKALMLGLVASGTVVYLRNNIFAALGMETNQWSSSDYFEALTLSATIFTLILSFRVARLTSRTRDEDNRTFAIFREIDSLTRRNAIDPGVRDHILAIGAAHGPDMENSYVQARRYLTEALERADSADTERLIALEVQLDALVHSRQQGIDFSEFCALFIFAGITVGLALVLRPENSGLIAFLTDMFTILFSSVIIFLAVNVFDLQRDRAAKVLEGNNSGHYMVVFRDLSRRMFERWVAILAGLGIVAAYGVLLGFKWLG